MFYLFEVGGGLNLPDGLHERVSDHELNVGAGVTLRLGAQLAVVLLGQFVWSGTHVELKHLIKKI